MIIYYNSANYCVTCMQCMFIIDPCEEAFIYRAWRTRAGKRLRDMFHDIYENGASTYWLTDEVLQALRAHWNSPRFKAKQVKARTSKGSTRGGSLHIGGSTNIEGTQLRMINIVLYSFSCSISVLNIMWSHGNFLKCGRRWWVGHRLRESCSGRPTPGSRTSLNGLIPS